MPETISARPSKSRAEIDARARDCRRTLEQVMCGKAILRDAPRPRAIEGRQERLWRFGMFDFLSRA
jgi:hypothetical protein